MKEDKNYLYPIKIALLGDSLLGKSCICRVFCGYGFEEHDMICCVANDKFDKKLIIENEINIKLMYFINSRFMNFHYMSNFLKSYIIKFVIIK